MLFGYLGQSNLPLSEDVVMSPSMEWDTLRNLAAGRSGSSWNFPEGEEIGGHFGDFRVFSDWRESLNISYPQSVRHTN